MDFSSIIKDIGGSKYIPKNDDLIFSLYYRENITKIDRIRGYVQSTYYLIFFLEPFILIVIGSLIIKTIKHIRN